MYIAVANDLLVGHRIWDMVQGANVTTGSTRSVVRCYLGN